MKWITAGDIEKWAASPSAKNDFPGLVADLIRSSSPSITAIRFPSGDKGQVRGFDGHLISEVASLNVPQGKSYWEFGTEAGYQAKAEGDLEKRKGDADKDVTIICVSSRTWDNPKLKLQDWETNQTKKYGWKSVKFIDGGILKDWLDTAHAVAAYHARYTLKKSPEDGARSTEEFWQEYSDRYKPRLTEDVVLCGREEVAKRIAATLSQGRDLLTLSADSPEEVIALSVAAIRKQAPELRYYLEAKTLVIDSIEAGRKLITKDNICFLLRGDASRTPGIFADAGPTVNALGRVQKNGQGQRLDRPSTHDFGRALSTMNYDYGAGLNQARACGSSLTVLARQIPSGHYDPPAWLEHAESLLPAILAGAWESSGSADRDVIAALAGKDYYDFERIARRFVAISDPPLDNEGTVWRIRAPMDALAECGHLVGPEHIEQLRPILKKVFSKISIEEERYSAESKADEYSQWLKDGLAGTLLLISVWQDQAGMKLPAGAGQKFADELVGSLPGLRDDQRLLVALRDQLPLLAEAAPLPLLEALELMLEGKGEVILPIFDLAEDYFMPKSFHTGLLWALETIAWIPEYFHRTVMVLTKLAVIDPGVKLVNKPINSLKEIFQPWLRNTNASAAQRLAALDEISQKYPAIGWDLLNALLPTGHGSSSGTRKPLLRGGGEERPLTRGDVWEMNSQVIARAIKLAEQEPKRLRALISGFANYSPADRQKVFEAVDAALSSSKSQEDIWNQLRDVIARHERFADAKWALPKAELKAWQELATKHEPKDALHKARWLFDGYLIDTPNEKTNYSKQRCSIVAEIFASEGPRGIVDFAKGVKLSHFVIEAISSLDFKASDLEAVLLQSVAELGRSDFTSSVSSLFQKAIGYSAAVDWITRNVMPLDSGQELAASMLLAWPNRRETWDVARSFGPDVDRMYWDAKHPLWLDGDVSELLEAINRFLVAGRPTAALRTALNRISEIPTNVLLDLIDAIPSELGNKDRDFSNLSYEIGTVFDALDKRDDISALEIARRELLYHPVFEFGERRMRTHEIMAANPSEYYGIFSGVFMAEGETRTDNPSPEQEATWRAYYSVLSNFDIIPGLDGGKLDASVLSAWLDGLRKLALDGGRAEIADQYIGHVLAHSPVDADGGWPLKDIRGEIERLKSDNVERGIMIERFNMRGVHTRGVFQGGDEERSFADTYRAYAKSAAAWPRTEAMLLQMAKNWDRDAEREDVSARQRKLRG